jgi:hypothetical protein
MFREYRCTPAVISYNNSARIVGPTHGMQCIPDGGSCRQFIQMTHREEEGHYNQSWYTSNPHFMSIKDTHLTTQPYQMIFNFYQL